MGGYLLLLFVLNIPASQRWLTQQIASALSGQLDAQVHIGEAEFGLFNRIALSDVQLFDQNQRKMLDGELLSVKIEFMPLLRGQVSLRSVSLLDGKIVLYKERADAPTNFQFLIDAFSPKKKQEKRPIDLRINSLILRRCDFAYDAHYLPERERFDVQHLHMEGINANISLKCLTPDSLNLRIRSLSLREHSGLDVRDLSLRLEANKRHCKISRFALRLPQSKIAKEDIELAYRSEDLLRTIRLNGTLSDATIATEDIACFIPKLKGLNQVAQLSTRFTISPSSIDFEKLLLAEQHGNLNLRGEAHISRNSGALCGIKARMEDLFVNAALLEKTVMAFAGKPLPRAVSRIGNVHFKGEADWRKDKAERSVFSGSLTTDAGSLAADVALRNDVLSGTLSTAEIRLAQLSDSLPYLPEKLAFTLKAKANINDKKRLLADADLKLSQMKYGIHTYSDIDARAKWRAGDFAFDVQSADANCNFTAKGDGRLKNGKPVAANLDLQVQNFVPQVLGLTDFFGAASFSTALSLSAKGTDLQNLQAEANLSDFRMRSAEGNYELALLNARVQPMEHGSHVEVNGDFVQAVLEGKLSAEALKATSLALLGRNLKGFENYRSELAEKDVWRFRAQLKKADFLQHICKVPLVLKSAVVAEGSLRADGQRMSMSLHTDGISYNDVTVDDIKLYLLSENANSTALVQAKKRIAKSDVQFVAEARTDAGKLQTALSLNDGTSNKYHGSISATTSFERNAESGDLSGYTRFSPTTFVVNDTAWNVASGSVLWGKKEVDISSFSLTHAIQSLTLDGRLSADTSDSLCVNLQNLNVKYILDLINFNAVEFAGSATGEAVFKRKGKDIALDAALFVPDFRFNDTYMGAADIRGQWNAAGKSIDLSADILEHGIGSTKVRGYVSPAHKELELNIKSDKTNLGLLRKYTDGIFSGLEGRTTGNLRLFGKFKYLDFEGEERCDLKATVVPTGVNYTVENARVLITPGKFAINNVRVSDGIRGQGNVSGYLSHENLKNLCYNFDISCENMLCYDMPEMVGSSFYSTTYGTGRVLLDGKPGSLFADISIRPTRGTTFVYSIDTPTALSDGALLTYAKKADEAETYEVEQNTDAAAQPTTMDIRLNFLVDVSPDAEIRIIMDEKAGDNIRVTGSGAIRASFYNKGAFRMYGPYTVERGLYKLSIQELIRKDFELRPGGRVNFNGDPLDADLDISATYTVPSVSLSDLNIGNSFSQNSVRVNCILNVEGKVSAPQISFDLDLPTVNEDEKQMVRNLISSEEDMNMQILYLLGVGRFYTYNYNSSEMASGQSQSSVAMNSFLSNTLSSQLNNIISSAMGSSNWTFGTNFSTGIEGWSDMEVAGLLSGRLLNNRLLINGNFGYRDRTDYTTNFVGDFDIRYLLTPSGGVSLKAYSETNDRYFTKSSLTTQGIGILLSRDFSNLRDLFRPANRKKRLPADSVPAPEAGRED